MTAAVRALVPAAFDVLRLHRVEAACIPTNLASVRLLEKDRLPARGLCPLLPVHQWDMAGPSALRAAANRSQSNATRDPAPLRDGPFGTRPWARHVPSAINAARIYLALAIADLSVGRGMGCRVGGVVCRVPNSVPRPDGCLGRAGPGLGGLLGASRRCRRCRRGSARPAPTPTHRRRHAGRRPCRRISNARRCRCGTAPRR